MVREYSEGFSRRRDLGDYIARQTEKHIKENVGSAGFRNNLFEADGNQIVVHGGYRISFLDDGFEIELAIDRHSGDLSDLYGKLKDLKIPSKYSDVFDKVQVDKPNDLRVVLTPKISKKSERRTSNRERIFYAVYHTAIKPIMFAAFESE